MDKVEHAEGWVKPEFIEDIVRNQDTLKLRMIPKQMEKSAKKSAENVQSTITKRYKQILELMEIDNPYSTEQIANEIGLKGPRTRQLLNELVELGHL